METFYFRGTNHANDQCLMMKVKCHRLLLIRANELVKIFAIHELQPTVRQTHLKLKIHQRRIRSNVMKNSLDRVNSVVSSMIEQREFTFIFE